MFDFENYRLEIYETQEDYHREIPEHRFVAHLKEIPEASLHAYGITQEDAIRNLREQFEFFVAEAKQKKIHLPSPEKQDEEEFSGRIVVRMPSWVHRLVDQLADEDGISTNSYIVNRLIRAGTMEEMVNRLMEREEKWLTRLSYLVHTTQKGIQFRTKSVSKLQLLTMVSPKLEYKETEFRKTG
jgi:predicted HicB family RNase H-like nuclease